MTNTRIPPKLLKNGVTIFIALLALGIILAVASQLYYAKSKGATPTDIVDALLLTISGEIINETAFEYVDTNWSENLAPLIIDLVYLSKNKPARVRLIELLETKTGLTYGFNLNDWRSWIWEQSWPPHPQFARFKSVLYGMIDPRFSEYFANNRPSTIRLDEVRWGGVLQDGIPPLHSPHMIPADMAGYLDDSNIVFGIEVNGDVRAYPKRILARHEMFTDNVGGVPVTGVYCTLCGTMILYKSEVNGALYSLGTSGFLYRSNKLMYDKETHSLWSTFQGTPVIGPLVEKDIQLERLSVVTTNWGEWKNRHPDSLVLSLDTGHLKDYTEGAAYRKYYATDELMFTVPKLDKRLKNKDEVLGLLLQNAPDKPLAISSDYLIKHPIYHSDVDGYGFVVLTDTSGAHRVYETAGTTFTSWDRRDALTDSTGITWKLSETMLTSADDQKLYRLPSQNSFWFGWYSAFNHTGLVY